MRAVDLSRYTGELADTSVQTLLDNDVQLLIVQAYGNPYAIQQASIWPRKVAAYTWPPSGWAEALTMMSAFNLEFLALDIESGVQMTRAMVDGVRNHGVRCVKYCSPYTWQTDMGNTLAFADVDTWLAYYRNRGWLDWSDVDHLRLIDNSRTVGVQIQGTTTLRDDQFDLNVFDPAYIISEDDLTPEQDRILREIWQKCDNIDRETDPMIAANPSLMSLVQDIHAITFDSVTATPDADTDMRRVIATYTAARRIERATQMIVDALVGAGVPPSDETIAKIADAVADELQSRLQS